MIKKLSSSTMVMAARAAGYRELIVNRSIVLSICPKCSKKRVIRFRKTAGQKKGAALVDRCWGCNYAAVVHEQPASTPTPAPKKDDLLCPCGCGDKRPSKKAQYAHGRVCAARIKAKQKPHVIDRGNNAASIGGQTVGMF